MIRKLSILIVIIFFVSTNTFSQESEDEIILETIGYGENQNEAVLDALRTALESSYGVFINSNTTIINDEIIKDEIKTIGSGNILDYQILDKIALDNETTVKVKSTVSISKMVSLGNSTGQQISFNGNVFSKDLKLQDLYEKNELNAIQQFLIQYKTYLNNAFDYEISSKSPKYIEMAGEDKYNIEFQIKVISNDNSLNNLISRLKLLSMNLNDAIKYKSLNKKVYPLIISLTEEEEIFLLLRSEESYNLFVSSFISSPLLSAIDLEFSDGLGTFGFIDLFEEKRMYESNFCFIDCGFLDDTSNRGNLYLNFRVGKKLEGGDTPMFNEFYKLSYDDLLLHHKFSQNIQSDEKNAQTNIRLEMLESYKSRNRRKYTGTEYAEIYTSGFRGKLKKIFSSTYSSKGDKNLFNNFIKLYRGVAIGSTNLNTTWICNQLSTKKPKNDDYFLKLRFSKSYSKSEIQNLKEFSVKRIVEDPLKKLVGLYNAVDSANQFKVLINKDGNLVMRKVGYSDGDPNILKPTSKNALTFTWLGVEVSFSEDTMKMRSKDVFGEWQRARIHKAVP